MSSFDTGSCRLASSKPVLDWCLLLPMQPPGSREGDWGEKWVGSFARPLAGHRRRADPAWTDVLLNIVPLAARLGEWLYRAMKHPNIAWQLTYPQKQHLLALCTPTQAEALAREVVHCAREGLDMDSVFEAPQAQRLVQAALAKYLKRRAGSVYVAAHAAFPGMVKIGMTRKAPEARVAQLTTAGLPGRYALIAAVPVQDAAFVEAQIHQTLAPAGESASCST